MFYFISGLNITVLYKLNAAIFYLDSRIRAFFSKDHCVCLLSDQCKRMFTLFFFGFKLNMFPPEFDLNSIHKTALKEVVLRICKRTSTKHYRSVRLTVQYYLTKQNNCMNTKSI